MALPIPPVGEGTALCFEFFSAQLWLLPSMPDSIRGGYNHLSTKSDHKVGKKKGKKSRKTK
jgi:hypothetical protein